ncbi:MAG TPA: malto-oligosyltrehalose synthase, partial [Gemmatimonadales bacterium]|nr:malto-oligosyltrehalose synthase [Gemmatimonadales bacterium]
LADLIRLDVVDGVRIDHVDGLYDPFGYLAALRALGPRQVWVEKILAPGELLPEGWPVEGSTGYDFMHEVTALLTYPGSRRALDRLWRRAAPDAPGWREEAYRSKQVVMQTVLSGDLTGLAHELDRIAERDYHTRDVTFEALREALADVIAGLQRYRTYLAHDGEGGAALLRETLEAARRRRAAGDPTPYDIIERVLLGAVREDLRADAAHWAHRFEQYCAPVAAKGVEDTACYRYLRLAAVNEVGGDPATIGMGLQAFHERGRARGARHPRTLLATSTHDAKRGEDTRMRMIALAELADDWRRLLAQLRPVLRRHRRRRGPSRADEYLFLQTLAALWEDGDRSGLADRLAAYMLKAAREAKLHTSWLHADPSYEEMLERFVRGVIADARTASILHPFAALLARYGFLNSITQTVLRLTAPGIPDVYQGSELLTLTLVDPDNRVAVDFERREQLLESLEPLLAEPTVEGVRAMAEARDERLKLYVTAALLRLRAAHPHLAAGTYLPLAAEGTAADHAVAYARVDGPSALLVIATRFPAVLERMEGWGDTSVPLPEAWADHTWRETLTGAEVAPGDAIRPAALALPWAVLLSP